MHSGGGKFVCTLVHMRHSYTVQMQIVKMLLTTTKTKRQTVSDVCVRVCAFVGVCVCVSLSSPDMRASMRRMHGETREPVPKQIILVFEHSTCATNEWEYTGVKSTRQISRQHFTVRNYASYVCMWNAKRSGFILNANTHSPYGTILCLRVQGRGGGQASPTIFIFSKIENWSTVSVVGTNATRWTYPAYPIQN